MSTVKVPADIEATIRRVAEKTGLDAETMLENARSLAGDPSLLRALDESLAELEKSDYRGC
ncbi:MAG: hypothetical protein Q8P45_00870 [Candidatus Harrisonbacteria bacterium]|nr:hypothetical protein [Candidatus Harrisonbacteria bacterium]